MRTVAAAATANGRGNVRHLAVAAAVATTAAAIAAVAAAMMTRLPQRSSGNNTLLAPAPVAVTLKHKASRI